jgi:biopolymer transport protein ExbD
MRRFSQRSGLVTLSEINITPLLDLAFVLLIIFIITTPLLERGIPLNLPIGGGKSEATKVQKENLRTVEISPKGEYWLNKRPMKLPQITEILKKDFQQNRELVVLIRADKTSLMQDFTAAVEACQSAGISKYSIRTEPGKK